MQSGTMLVHYEIKEIIGKGGMGEVYRAHDTKLERDVAVKILPPEFASDSDRMARFEREAKVLASLHHPNIASIFGFETTEACTFLVMELVEGDDLAEILRDGSLPVDEAVDVARQIAEGLEEAHERGIIHRDLKPANVKRTPDGKVKVLDFGLARAYAGQAAGEGQVSSAQTLTAPMTQVGTVLGTAAYMSPEQARGKDVDRRADIWSFGVILFEMLTGRPLFVGETASDTLAGILKSEPDWDSLPDNLPFQVERVIRRCLAKNPLQRLRDIGEARVRLEDPEAESGRFSGSMAAIPDTSGGFKRLIPWALLAVALAVAAVGWLARPAQKDPVFRQYDLELMTDLVTNEAIKPVVSPDGNLVATALPDSLGMPRILLRSLVTGAQEFAANTEGAGFPFWSPDSRFLGFFQDGRLRKMHVESGTVQVVYSDIEGFSRGGTWSSDDKILFAPGANHGLMLVDAEGGQSTRITEVDSTMADGSHRWPIFLPDGRSFLYTVWSNVLDERSEMGGVFLASLDGGEHRRILRDVSQVVYVSSGHLLFHRNERLMALAFDPASGQVSGEPSLVSKTIGFQPTNGLVCASANDLGDVFVGTHNPDSQIQIAWLDREGEVLEIISEEVPMIMDLELSPDGSHYAMERLDEVGSVEIWVGDIARGSLAPISRFDSDCWGPVFSPDGREVIYCAQTNSGAALYRQDIAGAKDAIPVAEFDHYDGNAMGSHWFAADQMLLQRADGQTKAFGIHLLDISAGTLTPVLVADFDHGSPRLSPDGRWLAYQSAESGILEVYVRNWPGLDQKWQVSRNGGAIPHWSDDGTELIYASMVQREVMAVDFGIENGEPRISLPRRATRHPQAITVFSCTGDHSRYLVGLSNDFSNLPPIKVLVGWGLQQNR